jgi:hypothetical protein
MPTTNATNALFEPREMRTTEATNASSSARIDAHKPHFFFAAFFLVPPFELARFRKAFFFPDCGHPFSIRSYDCLLTVERDFDRLFPARLRRLMLFTGEFLGLLAM